MEWSEWTSSLTHWRSHSPTPQVLDLSNHQLQADEVTALAYFGLHNDTTTLALYLTSNQIGQCGTIALSFALQTNSTLVVLDLTGVDMGGVGLRALTTAISRNPANAITELTLAANHLKDTDAQELARVLQLPTCKFLKLDVSRNDIQDEGVIALACALEVNAILTAL